MNRTGGKTGHDKIDLTRAFELLAEKRKALQKQEIPLKWQERAYSGILKKQTDSKELANFRKQLKKSINKHLPEM
jgi:hypothetical protein